MSNEALMSKEIKLNFDNMILRRLPIDTEEDNYVRTVSNACFSRVKPSPLKDPELVVYSKSALELIDIPEEATKSGDFVEYFVGNKLLEGSEPAAQCYCKFAVVVAREELGLKLFSFSP